MRNNPVAATLTVYLAEDDIDDQELITEAFSEINPSIQLITFTTGKKFIQYIEEASLSGVPDLILLDYNMPEMTGAEILQQLQKNEQFRSVVKLVWSTSSSMLFEKTCIELGAKAYLVKPSNISGLQDIVRKMLSFL